MRKSSSFMCVLICLLAGGAEATRPIATTSNALFSLVTMGLRAVDAWRPQDGCKKMGEIYTDGADMVNRMWNGAFTVTNQETDAYTMWWYEGGTAGTADAHDNPNDAVTLAIHNKSVPTTCDVQYFHKSTPSPETDDFHECHPWHANACCHQATVVTPQKLRDSYGEGYEWDRCGPLSQACERFFVMEACMYECEPSTGLYRKYTDAQHAACSADGVAEGATVTLADGSPYTCSIGAWGGNDENKWQLHAMPIKRSFADAWYRACASDLFCGTGDYFACAGDYHAQLAAEAKAAENTLPTYGIVLIIVAAVLVLLLFGFLFVMIQKEKAGKPVFTNLSDPAGKQPPAVVTDTSKA